MRVKKILFIGLGGAGQRHLRVLKECLPKARLTAFRAKRTAPFLNPDFSTRAGSLEKEHGLTVFDTLEEGLDDGPDLAVISNPSSLHYGPALQAARRGIDLLVEKPFSNDLNGFERFQDVVLAKKIRFMVSYQRRFHPWLRKIRDVLAQGKLGKIITASFHAGSYVPAWHPYEDFRKLYACRPELGGGVLLTEIHEFDLCFWYFGMPAKIYCSGGNYGGHTLKTEDTAHAVLKYKGFDATVNVCFMDPQSKRLALISGTKGYAEWDQEGNTLVIYDHPSRQKKVYTDPAFTNETMFKAQARYFLNDFGLVQTKEYLKAAQASLKMVETAKVSMNSGREITIT